jgi:hypothetical protein
MVPVACAIKRRVVVVCSTIVAALGFHVQLLAAPEDVPVPGGTVAVARALGLDAAPEAPRFVGEVTRLVLDVPRRRGISPSSALQRLQKQPPEVIPVPLTAAVWGNAVFKRRVAPEELLFAILGDPRASLLCHALAAMDDETLEYFGSHAGVLTTLYEREPIAFGAFGESIRIHGDRIVPPGGDAAGPLWEAVVGEPISRPERFIRALFALTEGRTAYLYDTVDKLDAPKAAFALGLWQDDRRARVDAMKTLTQNWTNAFHDWRLRSQPFIRQTNDAAVLLMRVSVEAQGTPVRPNTRGFWSQAFEGVSLPDDPAKLLAASDDRPVDAAWLVGKIEGSEGRQRADRLDAFSFGQRVFASASAAEAPDVLLAVRAFPRYRMLLLTLERMGITRPAIYAAAVRQASRLSLSDPLRAYAVNAQFQGALALLRRMEDVGTFEPARVEALVLELMAVPLDDRGGYGGALVRWLDESLRRALPNDESLETALVDALAGPAGGEAVPRITWEGLPYRFDPGVFERRRLQRVREKQSTPAFDVLLDLDRAARTLASPSLAMADAEAVARQLRTIAGSLPQGGAGDADAFAPGVVPPRDGRDVVVKAADELEKSIAAKDIRRASRVAAAITEISDELCGQTLVSIVYAVSLGDPDGAAFLASDVSRRHDFGFGSRDSENRLRAAWLMPNQNVGPGIAWHVDGSLLGLDVALAPLELRRLSANRALEAPTINSNEREGFAVNVALIRPLAIDDASRDAVIEAVDRGRQRVSVLARGNQRELDRIADTLGMDGRRRRAARWILARDPAKLETMFSLGEFAALGDASGRLDLRPWGTSAIATDGCVCTNVPGRWQTFTGRPQGGMMAAAVLDVHLHVARMLRQLRLPARLEKYVLGAAVQDFVDEVRPTDSDDWLTLVRTAQSIPRERIEDYVAAAAAEGPLIPDEGS